MNDLWTAFSLGSGAILTNACMLPLYPGLLALLAGSAEDEHSRRAAGWFGALVLAGVLTMMLLIGLLLTLVKQSFSAALPVLLPLVYSIVIVMGLLMLTGRNPFAKLATGQIPLFRSPYITAYVYGLLFAPMTLPCTGPVITGAFGAFLVSSGTGAQQLLFFLAFGLGFGWPLVMLALLAIPAQRTLTRWVTRQHTLLERASGILLVAIGIFGLGTEFFPQYVDALEIQSSAWMAYWLAVAALIVGVSIYTYRASAET